MAGDVPVLLINEPMFISQGENSDIRYNFYYPRWAYDAYRQILGELSEQNNWNYIDLWDSVSNKEFTNSAVHLSQRGSAQFAQRVLDAVIEAAER
jgi:lysophospholipase L1-like esterase